MMFVNVLVFVLQLFTPVYCMTTELSPYNKQTEGVDSYKLLYAFREHLFSNGNLQHVRAETKDASEFEEDIIAKELKFAEDMTKSLQAYFVFSKYVLYRSKSSKDGYLYGENLKLLQEAQQKFEEWQKGSKECLKSLQEAQQAHDEWQKEIEEGEIECDLEIQRQKRKSFQERVEQTQSSLEERLHGFLYWEKLCRLGFFLKENQWGFFWLERPINLLQFIFLTFFLTMVYWILKDSDFAIWKAVNFLLSCLEALNYIYLIFWGFFYSFFEATNE